MTVIFLQSLAGAAKNFVCVYDGRMLNNENDDSASEY